MRFKATPEAEKTPEVKFEEHLIHQANEWNWAAAKGRVSLPPAIPFVEMGSTATKIIVAVYNSFAIKDALKTRGYRFSVLQVAWCKTCDTIEDADIEAAELGIQLGNGRERN